MSLKLRLARAGTKKRPYYHIVLADARSPRDGRFIEKIGTYDPMLADDSKRVTLNAERATHWLGRRRPADRSRAAFPRRRGPAEARSRATTRNAPSRARRPPSASKPAPRPLPTRPPRLPAEAPAAE